MHLDGFTITGGLAIGGGDVSNISSFKGDGMFCDGRGAVGECNPKLTSINFVGNQAGEGGAMYNSSSNPTLNGTHFSGNQANGGGAIYNSSSNPTLSKATFSDNQAQYEGGAMLNFDSSPILVDAEFLGNQALEGGAIYNINFNFGPSNLTLLTNVSFSGNYAVNGGAIYIHSDSYLTLTNVSFAQNQASFEGGAMYISSGAPTIQNSVFWGNTALNGPQIFNHSATPLISYSLFEDDLPTGSLNRGNNLFNIATSPFMTDPSPAPSMDGNLQLKAGTPAIDAGNNAADLDGEGPNTDTINNIATDLAGNTRIVNGTVDMGAYEKQQ